MVWETGSCSSSKNAEEDSVLLCSQDHPNVVQWEKNNATFEGLCLLADVAVAMYYEEEKMLQVIGQGASERSEDYEYVGKMPSNAVEKAEIVLLPTSFIPACCKRRRTNLCSPTTEEVLACSLDRCQDVRGSSTGSEEEPLSPKPLSTVFPAEKDKKKEQVKRVWPTKKPRQEGPKPFEPKDMPQDLRYYIEATLGGTDIFPVSQKTLTATDVKSHHRRVFLPKADIAFLNEEEKAILERLITKDRGIPVQVLDPRRKRELRRLTFTRWDLKKNNDSGKASTVYVLTTAGWSKLVEDNELGAGDEIQIWSFRVGSQLHMAVIVAKRALQPLPQA